MTGFEVVLSDGIHARISEAHILDTYAGQLAGTMTVGTRHQLPGLISLMNELKAGRKKGCYFISPELVDEATLRDIPPAMAERIRRYTELAECLKEHHVVATLQVSDEDHCHIIEVHWFQTSRELSEKPLTLLIQEAVGQLSFEEQLYPCCEHVDWEEF